MEDFVFVEFEGLDLDLGHLVDETDELVAPTFGLGLQGEVVWTERSLEMTFPKQVVATDLKKKLFVIPNCAQIAFILLE